MTLKKLRKCSDVINVQIDEVISDHIFSYVCKSDNVYGMGISFDQELAKIKATAEFIERYSLRNYKKSIIASFEELEDALDPGRVINFSDTLLKGKRQEYIQKLRKTKISWVKTDTILIPEQLVSVKDFEEPVIRVPISTGAAFGDTKEDAIKRGILECIERDSFMLVWLEKKERDLIELTDNEKFSFIQEKIYLVDITSDLEIPSVLAFLIDDSGNSHAVTAGLKSDSNYQSAIEGAILEAYNSKLLLNHLNQKDDRIKFWSNPKSIIELDFLLKGDVKSFKHLNIKRISEHLNKKNVEFYTVDMTNDKFKDSGFVMKTIIPSLHPLSYNEEFPYDYSERLNKITNKTPHPLF